MSDSSGQPPPTLEYSTVATEGPPRWHPQAEALVYLGNPPEALLGFFESPRDAVRYYAMSMSRRFDVSRLDDRCILCGSHSMERVVRVGWRARLKLSGASAPPWRRDAMADFTTLHPICRPCYVRWRKRNRAAAMWIIGIAGLMLIGLGAVGLNLVVRGMRPEFTVPGLVGMTMIISVVAAAALEGLAWKRPRQFRGMFPRSIAASGDLELLPRPVAREAAEQSP